MNSSSYDSNIVHQDHHSVQHQVPNGHLSHHNNIQPGIGNYFLPPASTLPISEHQQSIQLQLPNISRCADKSPEMTSNSVPITTTGSAGLFGPRQIPLTTALSKTFFNSTVNGIQPSSQRFYGGVAPTTLSSTSSNSIQQTNRPHHQQGNTILITNNFSANQYGPNHPHVVGTSSQMQPRTTSGAANSGPSAANTLTGCYHNGNASNIRIITTLPNSLHQQQQQHIYNMAKDVESTGRDDIIQLPQFYNTPHQQSAYAQHLSTALPTHFAQQHFSAPTSSPTALHITQDDAQHQFFMSMTNNGNGSVATANNISVPKLISTITEESATVGDVANTSSTLVSSPATTTSSNSTLVLDRINICINNHYSDTSGTNNGLEMNATIATTARTSPDNIYSLASHAPQQPSPIIPAIHHKVVLDPVSNGGGSGTMHTDSYASNDSTIVIDEPDSTTTTPHTPPTTPENSSSPPLPLNLSPTRNIIDSQSISSQIIIGNSLNEAKGNNITSQTTVCTPAKKRLVDKTISNAAVEAIATITHSIDLLDDEEECEYVMSDVENGTDTERVAQTNEISEDSIMEIEDNEVEFSTPEAIRMKNTIKCDDAASPNLISQQHDIPVLHDSSEDVDLKLSKSVSPPSPTPVNIIQATANETASSVTLLTPPTPTTSSPGSLDSLIAEKKNANSSVSLLETSFTMGEDVFIRKDDGRQYLGTVIGSSADSDMSELQKVQYLIRFDDNSELWCGIEEMRRLGSSVGNGNAQMCVACKRVQEQDVIETCEDCRRGYHRSCTRETTPGSGIWFCLRCNKPMKERARVVAKHLCMSSSGNNKYKNSDEVSKISSPSQRKTPPDIYEFRIEENEIFTSDDEIPIKHIMEKARKSKDSIQIANASSLRPKSVKKLTNKDIISCEKIPVLDDENANDANIIIQSVHSIRKDKIKEKDVSPLKNPQCMTSIKQSTDEREFDVKTEDRVLVSNAVNANSSSIVYNNVSSIVTERSSRKRKAFKLSNSYKEIAAEAAAKRYDSSRICDSSSDENSSSSRGTSLDVIIPPPKNFLGLNNPFRIITPKKNIPASQTTGTSSGCVQNLLNFNRSGTMIKNSIFNTTALDFSSKLAALKSAGIFPNLSTSNLAKAAGQPRTVRTIKRRLSAKDITIGPNQEVRRRRTRRLSSNVEVISTTTINPIPRNFFPIHAKDLLTTQTTHLATTNTTRVLSTFNKQQIQRQTTSAATASFSSISSSSSTSSSPPGSMSSNVDAQVEIIQQVKPSHGRRLRQRPQKNSPANSRRSSVSSASTVSSTNSSSNITLAALQQQQQQHQALHKNSNKNANANSMQDLKQSVKEYFGGAVNRIESGEQFCIRAKRQLADGQMQYLIEWGDVATASLQGQLTQTTAKFTTAT
uniref:Polycomb protein Pcl n=1 Tax=Zeugodacus cucurbitae TaxID=28588 RepID=A0A0A1XRV0_ZEUCU